MSVSNKNRSNDVFILLAELKECSNSRDLSRGRAVHAVAVAIGMHSHIFVASTLVSMYAKCGSMSDAQSAFNRMAGRNVVAWTSLILGYADNGEEEHALDLFEAMLLADGCQPDGPAFIAALKACTCIGMKEEARFIDGRSVKMEALRKGRRIHSMATKRMLDRRLYVASTLVDMYAKCGCMVSSRQSFELMETRNVVAWNALIMGYADNGAGFEGLQVYQRMRNHGGIDPDALTFVAALKACSGKEGWCLKQGTLVRSQAALEGLERHAFVECTLVDMYAKCGNMVEACKIFDRIHYPNVASWTALTMGYIENGAGEFALDAFVSMRRSGCVPDGPAFIAALKACGMLSSLEIGRSIHEDLCRCGLDSNVFVRSALVDFYGKCGCMSEARRLFESQIKKNNLVTWNALILGYSRCGESQEVFNLFEEMQRVSGVLPDGITMLSLLTACSHAGLVDRGKEYFELMQWKYGILPWIEHYVCMADMLCRASEIKAALDMVRSMPYEPDVVTLRTVLGACCMWKNVELGKLAFDRLLMLNARDSTAYVLMSSIYKSRGMWEEHFKVEKARAEHNTQ